MKPNISIIIPVYNVEAYLADCLDSILAQTFESFEVILVDDGSTDGSPAIAQKYADAHSEQIRYYRKENGGPGLARNFGISKAKGDYLMFVDSDDIVDPEMLTDLYESAFVLESDIIFCPYFRHGLYQEVTIEGTYDFDMDKVYTGTDFLRQSDYTVTTCSKLYRTAFVKQFAFPAHWFEDVAWLPVVMSYAKKISYVSTPYYHYLRHDTSIVSSTSNKQILGSLDAIRFIVQNANPEAASEVAPFTASLTLYMCTRRPAFADRYVDLLMENKNFILSNTNFEEHPRLKVRLDYYYNAFQAIPKHIYYDHFGKTTLTEQEQNNLDTLVGTLVEFDAKITCLNEENCDIDEHPAIRKAYDEGRYHVVGQYFKCKKLMEEGGIALSKQVRGIKYITPLLLRTQALFGFQNDTSITERIYAAVAGHPVMQEIFDVFMAHIDQDDAMTIAMREILMQKNQLTYSYDLECNFKQKYLTAYNETVRVYATCVLAHDYGIGSAYSDCHTKPLSKEIKNGTEYTLVDSFYFDTLLRITKDYTVYQMNRERQNKANETFFLHRKIGNLRNRMHRQAMRITVLKDRSENIKMHYDAVTRMKIIWYPYQFLRKLFPAKDVKAWMTQREADKKLAYFRQIIEQPEEEAE